jgi:CubicO group peptidase (beta-lactamase class C family)
MSVLRKRLRLVGLAAAAFLAAGPATALPADLAARASAILEASYPADGPGAVVIISQGGRTLFAGGRGLADIRTGRPLTSDSLFRLGSVTKQFTAAAVLKLVEEGRISLDDPLSRFLPDYPQPIASATVRQLLNHTAGVQSYNEIPGWMVEANTNRPYTTAQLIDLFKDLPPRAPPGEAWAYSNSGYVLLAAVIEAVTGAPWHEAVELRVAGPAGLATIGYGEERESGPAMVRGYSHDATGAVSPARPTHMSVPHAGAGLVGTVGDLARWGHALHGGRVLTAPLYEAMTSPTTLPDGRVQPYGFGLAFSDVRGRRAVRHDGRIAGFMNEAVSIPSDDIVVAVLTNSDEPATSPALVGLRLAALALGEPYRLFTRIDMDTAALDPLLGVYEGPAGVSRRFLRRGGELYVSRNGGAEREVLAAAENHFFYPDSFTWFRIDRRPGEAPTMHLHQNDAPEAEVATRTGDGAAGQERASDQ